jgi:hypothetical protein
MIMFYEKMTIVTLCVQRHDKLCMTTRKIVQLFAEIPVPKLGCFKLNLVNRSDSRQPVLNPEASNE